MFENYPMEGARIKAYLDEHGLEATLDFCARTNGIYYQHVRERTKYGRSEPYRTTLLLSCREFTRFLRVFNRKPRMMSDGKRTKKTRDVSVG